MYWSPTFWHACCLLGYIRPREPTNERRSHQNAGFSIWVFKKISGGDTPGSPQREGATPSRTHPSPASGRAWCACAPVLGPKPWSPSTFQPWLRPAAPLCTAEWVRSYKLVSYYQPSVSNFRITYSLLPYYVSAYGICEGRCHNKQCDFVTRWY